MSSKLPFSFLYSYTMNARFQRSIGQGSLHSKMSKKISSNPSIASRLFSRSVTGRNLNIQIHQHFSKTIHLVWKTLDNTKRRNPSERCMERFFILYEELENFCRELKYSALEGLRDCVFPGLCRLLDTKVTICFRRPLLQIERDFPRCWLKWYQEFFDLSPCECRVSSTAVLRWNKKCSSTCVHAITISQSSFMNFLEAIGL